MGTQQHCQGAVGWAVDIGASADGRSTPTARDGSQLQIVLTTLAGGTACHAEGGEDRGQRGWRGGIRFVRGEVDGDLVGALEGVGTGVQDFAAAQELPPLLSREVPAVNLRVGSWMECRGAGMFPGVSVCSGKLVLITLPHVNRRQQAPKELGTSGGGN